MKISASLPQITYISPTNPSMKRERNSRNFCVCYHFLFLT